MRAWENRPDCRVVDEPFYAVFLAATSIEHPGREESIAAGETDWEKVVAELTAPVEGIYYQKQMAHHLVPEIERGWINSLTNVLLIRDPADMVASYTRQREAAVETDFGLTQLVELHEQLGAGVPVIDAADFLDAPELYLRWVCEWIGVGFTEAMLEWPPGPRASDGVWAKYWYEAVIASTGFAPYRKWTGELPPAARQIAESLREKYEQLYSVRLRLG
jgi:hypothetical protein